MATAFGSFSVQARCMASPRWPAALAQKRAKRSAVAGWAQAAAATQRGVLKWWKVTTGSMPSSRQPAHMAR